MGKLDKNSKDSPWFARKFSGNFASLKPSFDGSPVWLWSVGIGRIGLLFVLALGNQTLNISDEFAFLILSIYAAALCCALWYLLELYRSRTVSATLTWTQMLVDYGVVAATISVTGGPESLFTFLFVVVILEAGVLMGFVQAFLFAGLVIAFITVEAFRHISPDREAMFVWYDILIQGIAFLFTAFISGYWNQRISRMKQFQREILDNMNNGFLIADTNGRLIALNKAGLEILDYKKDVPRGVPVHKLLHPDSGAECPVDTALRSGKDFTSYEFFVRTGEDKVKLLGLTTNRILGRKGEISSIIASFTDLTEMARMRQELQQQDRMATIGELTASLAHEIRNPVASIRGAMDEMRNNTDSPEMSARLAAIAIRESDHLNELVTGFLDFARDPQKRHKRVDLCPLLEEVAQQLRWKYSENEGKSGESPLRIECSLPEAPCEVMANPTQMKQVFTNICQNAIEAMHGDGMVKITMELPATQADGGGPLVIHIEDDGPGIEPDMVARIFEPFYTSKERGVGMGLAICMRLVTAHDGSIQAASRPGKGTTFTIRLPLAPAQAKEEVQ